MLTKLCRLKLGGPVIMPHCTLYCSDTLFVDVMMFILYFILCYFKNGVVVSVGNVFILVTLLGLYHIIYTFL